MVSPLVVVSAQGYAPAGPVPPFEESMPTFEEISPRPLDSRLLQLSGISRASVEAHYRLYQGYVAKRNELLGLLGTSICPRRTRCTRMFVRSRST